MTDTEWERGNVLDLFGDSLCRQILVVASGSPVSAATLADRLDVSPPTVYRRLDSLVDQGLVRERQRIDADGNHYRTFEATLDRIEIAIEDGGYAISVHQRRNLADQFAGLWTEFVESSPAAVSDRGDRRTGFDAESDSST